MASNNMETERTIDIGNSRRSTIDEEEHPEDLMSDKDTVGVNLSA